eukprot:GILK01004724.1.p1 GENE.GILK01004724.1~~GILK01004724.1.p1  ORF type:complete len:580 (+),score=48.47 GILK01004724.1:46-1740(+)
MEDEDNRSLLELLLAAKAPRQLAEEEVAKLGLAQTVSLWKCVPPDEMPTFNLRPGTLSIIRRLTDHPPPIVAVSEATSSSSMKRKVDQILTLLESPHKKQLLLSVVEFSSSHNLTSAERMDAQLAPKLTHLPVGQFWLPLDSTKPFVADAFVNPPREAQGENTVYHPFFQTHCLKLCTAELPPPLENTKHRRILPSFHTIAQAGVSPDFCLLDSSDSPLHFMYVRRVFELKVACHTFSKEDIDQVLGYGQRLCALQHRSSASVALCDCSQLLVFRVEADVQDARVPWRFAYVGPLGLRTLEGQRVLRSLLLDRSEGLILPVLAYDPTLGLTCTGFLGKGGQASVFKVRDVDSTEYVHKQFDTPLRKEHMLSESNNLTRLLGVEGVPRIIARNPDSCCLLLQPVGIPLSSSGMLRCADVQSLLAILKDAHERAGLVHRDLHPGNMYRVDEHFMLNDWGLAVTKSTHHSVAGVLGFQSNAVLADAISGQPHRYEPADDLHSVVRLIFVYVQCLMPQLTAIGNNPALVSQFWSEKPQMQMDIWTRLQAAAEILDYSFDNVLPQLLPA